MLTALPPLPQVWQKYKLSIVLITADLLESLCNTQRTEQDLPSLTSPP